MEEGQEKLVEEPVYITRLEINGVNCFKGEYAIDFTDEQGKPALWTVFLGNNNTGKTTILKAISSLGTGLYPDGNTKEFSEEERDYYHNNAGHIDIEKHFTPMCKLEESEIDNSQCLITTNTRDTTSSFIRFEETTGCQSIYLPIVIDAYGTQRKKGKVSFIEYELDNRVESLFEDDTNSIINAEEWFLGIDYNFKSGHESSGKNLEQVKAALIQVLPDVVDISTNIDGKRRVYFHTKAGDKVLINQLGSGYQSLITWVVDYAKRQFDRYPESSNPLAEPGIVLVDEIDLHLHPTWQRKVINFLRGLFPKTQFIVTAHSPLVVQSADDINVVVLHRDEETEEIRIEQPELTNFQGWSVEEILRDLMDAQVYSNEYLALTQQFEQALQEDDYPRAKEAYDQLEKIVKSTATLKMFRIQMAGLTLPAND